LKISVITATYNSASTIENSLLSFINQDYENKELIIIDGGSTDETLSIIEKYKSAVSIIISEKDNGIYDALNKGISIATGDVIAILHSDDFYIHNHVLSKVIETFIAYKSDSVYGNLIYVDRIDTNRIIRKWISGNYIHGKFIQGWMPPHPAFFAKKECYNRYGKFNLSLRSSADYELMLRFLHKHKISTAYLNEFLVKMRIGGQSNVSLKNRIKANREDKLAWELNDLKPAFYTLFFKPLRKLIQFLR
jgi:glycosyltransferase involved in cell wall biosynthesis